VWCLRPSTTLEGAAFFEIRNVTVALRRCNTQVSGIACRRDSGCATRSIEGLSNTSPRALRDSTSIDSVGVNAKDEIAALIKNYFENC
jgi:hypothetical protein